MKFRLGKTITLVFVTCALQAYAIAGPPLMGKLRTRDNKPVLVNGNKASSGTTLLSGSQIQSPEKIGATVDLGSLGRLDMAPKTDLTLNFSATEISVQLKSGCAVLTTKKGISGRVTTSEGNVFQTDSSKLSSVLARTKECEGPETALPIGAAAGGLGAGGTAGVAGAGAAVVGGTAAAKAGARGAALSGDNPRQP
jgi:hypothetical protein